MSDAGTPHNREAEQGVLGGVLVDNSTFTWAAERLGAGDFYAPANKLIWKAIADLIQAGKTADGVTLKDMFERDDTLQTIGGARYLADLMDGAAFGPEVKDYAELVRDLSLRRRMIEEGRKLIERATVRAPKAGEVAMHVAAAVEGLQDFASTITPDRWVDSRMATINAVRDAALAQTSAGIETGIEALDRKLGGLWRGDLIIIGGRPGMGKSALCDQIESNVALQPSPDPERGSQGPLNRPELRRRVVAKFSLEMDTRQLGFRNAARMTQQSQGAIVSYESIRANRYAQADGPKIKAAMDHLPLVHWDDTPNVDINHMRAQLRRLMKRYGRIDLITCDYIQIMEQRRERGENLSESLGKISKGLKLIAREFDAPVIALSQLSREVEKREDKRPVLSDLRDSGSIEADADTVLFAYREHYYKSREPEPKEAAKAQDWEAYLADIEPKLTAILAKQRMGQPGEVGLYWNAATSWIVSRRDQLAGDLFREFA